MVDKCLPGGVMIGDKATNAANKGGVNLWRNFSCRCGFIHCLSSR